MNSEVLADVHSQEASRKRQEFQVEVPGCNRPMSLSWCFSILPVGVKPKILELPVSFLEHSPSKPHTVPDTDRRQPYPTGGALSRVGPTAVLKLTHQCLKFSREVSGREKSTPDSCALSSLTHFCDLSSVDSASRFTFHL